MYPFVLGANCDSTSELKISADAAENPFRISTSIFRFHLLLQKHTCFQECSGTRFVICG
jgi:hypothetical protein